MQGELAKDNQFIKGLRF